MVAGKLSYTPTPVRALRTTSEMVYAAGQRLNEQDIIDIDQDL